MRIVAAIALLSLAASMLAEEPPPPAGYSRETLLRLLAQRDVEPHRLPPRRVQWHLGYVEFRALGMDWRVMYLPLAVPLAGTRLDEIGRVPNAFELTNMQFPGREPGMPDRPRAVNRETRRVLSMEKRAKIKIDPIRP